MLPTMITIIESEWWALKADLGQGASYTRASRSFLTARAAEPRFHPRRLHRAIKIVKERSAIARFKVDGEDAYFLAWTTTPWTLPSNVALCVNPDETYCKGKGSRRIHLLYGRGTCLTKYLASLQRKKASLHMRFWKPIKEKTWNTRNMSRCLNAQMTVQQTRTRKRIIS